MAERLTQLGAFGLREQPFAPTADPSYFCATREHKSCLYRLWRSIDERHGIAVILGAYGTGKTTLLRKLMSGMAADPRKYNTAVIGSPIPSWTSFALLEAIIRQFRLKPAERTFASYMESLNQHLLADRHRGNTLIIDDAQNLNKRGQLELLRLAQNLETPQHKLLNLVLFAQMEWSQVLRAAPNFAQRINLTYTLGPLQADEVREFIEFRLARAAERPKLAPEFTDGAVEIIHAFSEGNPRLIVTLCRNALLFGAQIDSRRIDQDIVLHTIEKTTLADPARQEQLEAVSRAEAAGDAIGPARDARVVAWPQTSGPRRARAYDNQANDLLLRAARAKQQGQ
jgi:general secretion pathway protein A